MDSKYNHSLYESEIYSDWEKQGCFNPDTNGRGETGQPFTVIMPPPNANDPLHVGHAMFATIEDIFVRFHRMKGDPTLWQPGADHAGIETQFVFEKKLAKKGQSRFQLDRQTLYSQIWDYVQENAHLATSQLKRIGASADWSRFKYTLDPDIVQTVLQTFLKLHQDGLVYRDLKLVNYCPKCGTAFSDLEVKHTPTTTPLYYLKYGPFVLATTRPETKFGDTAVAVHPDDPRYQKYIGQTIEVDGLNGPFKVKVIADQYVDPEFGTGVVKITPAHDHNDYEVYLRHQEEIGPDGIKQVIGFDGRLNQLTGPYAGMKVAAAREQIVQDLTARGMLDGVDHQYQNVINQCYRCGSTLEPLPLTQLFVKVNDSQNSLTQPIIQAINEGQVKIHGAGRDKILLNWLENLHDWNISRQIVWGIRQPLWYNAETNPRLHVVFLNSQGEKVTGSLQDLLITYTLADIKKGLQTLDAPLDATFEISLTEPSPHHLQETDTFDTWFSSSQWPFATLQNTQPNDFERFYPTQLMETAYDILPFWVMRMLFMGYYATGKLPFKHVYFHGLIRDPKGQKMSKSKGNVVNPLDIADQYGADALRLALVIRSTPGLDKSVGEADFRAARNFTNKLWNAARFVLMLNEEAKKRENSDVSSKNDQEFIAKINQVVTEITQNLLDYKPGLAAESLYNYFWHYFCDEIIEKAKSGEISLAALNHGLEVFLRLLHPFVPFVTQAIWQEIKPIYQVNHEKQPADNLIIATWPAPDQA